jgi:hypothetical protein
VRNAEVIGCEANCCAKRVQYAAEIIKRGDKLISTPSCDIHTMWRLLAKKIRIGGKQKEDTVRRSDRLILKEKRLAKQK